MLILTRAYEEWIYIDLPNGDRIKIIVMEKLKSGKRDCSRVRLGIDAPKDCSIMRSELENKR